MSVSGRGTLLAARKSAESSTSVGGEGTGELYPSAPGTGSASH